MKFVSFLLVLLNGCAYSVHQVHTSDFTGYTPKRDGKTIEAHSEQFVILGFTSQVDYVDIAYQRLKRKCPKGEIVGLTTEHGSELGFFSYTNHIYIKGQCL